MKRFILSLVALPVALLLWGFLNGVADVNSGQHNLLTLAQRANSMNLITKEGYKLGLRTNSEFVERIEMFE